MRKIFLKNFRRFIIGVFFGDTLLKSAHCRAAVKPCKACKGGWNGIGYRAKEKAA